MCKILSDVLTLVALDPNTYHNNDSLARVGRMSASKMSRFRSGDAEITATEVQTISIHLAHNDDLRLAYCFIPPQFEIVRRGAGTANGLIDDDVAEMAEAIGSVRSTFKETDVEKLTRAIEMAEQALLNMKAERDRLGNTHF
jgi:hypothetical protein